MDAKLERNRRRWLNRFAAEFRRLEGLAPVRNMLPGENGPTWLGNVQSEYVRATHPAADLVGAKELTPARLGGLLGHQCANAVWMMEVFAKMIHQAEQTEESNLPALAAADLDKANETWRKFNEWYTALRHLAGRVLKSVVYQSYEDMSAFLLAYSNAFNRKPKVTAGLGDFGNTTFAIYHFMLINWRVVDRLDSVSSLHELLRKHIGEYRTGDLKRVEKICQRIGLHYRKPGRPKRPRNIQTPS